MDSPSPIAASIDVPDAVLRKNLQNTGSDGGLDEIREHIISAMSNNADNGNVKHIARAAYPGQAKQVIASETGVIRIVDEVGRTLDEPMAKFQSGSSPEEGHRPTVDSVAKSKGASDLKPKGADLGSKEIIMQIQASQLSSNEPASIEDCKLLIGSIGKDKIEIGQREVSDLRSKMEIAVVDLGSNNDREIIMKIQPSQSSSNELRLGECCWPTKESTADDKIKICDRKITSEREIIDVELGLDKTTLVPKERHRLTVDAINDKIGTDRSSFNKIKPEKSPELMVKNVAKEKVDVSNKKINAKKEIVDIELDFIDADDVVKVQPVHSNHSIVRLQEDHKLMIEKLTNEFKSKLDKEKSESKENLQLDKTSQDDTELIKFNSERKNNVEIDDAGIVSEKEIANLEMDKVEYLEAKATTLSPNISITSLDGRHECALSDFSVDKEDYRLKQYGLNEDEGEKESICIARSNLTKYIDDQKEDTIDEFASDDKTITKESDIQAYNSQVLVNAIHEYHEKESEYFTTEEIDNRAKSSEELDQSKFIVEWSQAEIEADEKVNVENGERSEEISRISREIDNERIEKESEFDTQSSERRTTSCDSSLEIDGKYLKSIVNSRKSPRKIRVDQIRDFETKEQYISIDEPESIQSEELQSFSTKTKSFERLEEQQIYDIDTDVEKKDKISENRETSRAEKVFQSSSRSASVKGKSSRKIEEPQVDEDERKFKEQHKSINDREVSRSEKTSQKSSKTSTSAKNSKKSKQSQIFYRSDEMKNYDRSVNDRVISQLEAVFQDSSKKSSTKTEIPKKDPENRIELKKQTRPPDNREFFRSEEFSHHSSRTSSTKSPKKTQDQKTVRLNDDKMQQETIKTTKDADNRTKRDLNDIKDVYTRKVRRYNVPLQGSLDSMIVPDESPAQKPKKDDAFSKKSKSYESIKRIQEVFLGVPSTKTNSSSSQLDIPDEFCSICCYMNEITFRTEEEVSSPNQETFYTLRSTCSSLADDDDDNDSIECDICGSLNLQESTDDLEDKIQEIPCELCRICGEVDGSYDQDSMPLDRYAFKLVEHQDDDDSFEIENCGFQSGTESADDRSRLSEKEKIKDTGRSKSQSLFIHGSSMIRDQPRELYFIPKDEIAILTSGTRKTGRKGSLFRKKEDSDGSARDKRRYSSVDSLQLAKMSPKVSDKALKTAKNPTLIGSADNLLITKDSNKSKSLQRSTDNLDVLNLSTDNLDSTENLEKVSDAEGSAEKSNIRDKEAVKMILTQHGIKVISEKETAL